MEAQPRERTQETVGNFAEFSRRACSREEILRLQLGKGLFPFSFSGLMHQLRLPEVVPAATG